MSIIEKPKSLKYKLAISHISMIIIPLLLLGIGELLWHHMINPHYSSPEEPKIEGNLKQNNALVAELESLINSNPDKLMDVTYLRKLNRQADELYIIVEKNGEFLYIPDRIDRNIQFSDKSSGYIYFLAKDKPPGPGEALVFIIALLFGMLINIFISYHTASNIITPLGVLNRATTEISKGNLEYSIEPSYEDEVGELCQSFETMRIQLKEAQSLSQSYEKNRKELIANISHDLKTPITSIRGYVQGIMEGVASTPEKESKYIQSIYSNAIQMDRLIDELFLFSKLDLNQLQFEFEAINIEDFLHDCVEDKGYDLENKGIKLSFTSTYSSKSLVMADRQRLQRVINNITANVEQHQDPLKNQTMLDIILSENTDEVIIEIKDNGKGINNENLPYIFDRLYRGDPSRNRQIKGSGLGLSIAKQIIEAHGGQIWAESEVDMGTSIFFTLKKHIL
ncbi:MAG: HAMP domain-containing sensor histidine kinase [Syntrophomonadaceae bacterium]|nr:HAMP domain-containing sensor histidine kinase [Syntrophomonadaceae bacterium]